MERYIMQTYKIGDKFGRLTLIKYLGKSRWLCKCSCGKIKEVSTGHLKDGHTRSCGCLQKDITRKRNLGKHTTFKNLVGKKFNRWTVLKVSNRKSKNGGYYYWCKCDCGKIKEVTSDSLVNGRSKSCGCLQKEKVSILGKNKLIDLTGKKFGRIIVMYKNGRNKNNKILWHCKCSCGNECDKTSASLLNRGTQSCGCLKHSPNHDNLVGKVFRNIQIIKFSHIKDSNSYWWGKCLLCGSIKEYAACNLKKNIMNSCGCLSISQNGSAPEHEIYSYIKEEFSDLEIERHNREILDGKELDLYIPEKKIAIEYNGDAFHASKNGIFEDKLENYHQQKFLECKQRGISLISIFERDWIIHKKFILSYIKHIILGKKFKFTKDNIITHNDFGIVKLNNYKEIKQINPSKYINRNYVVYRSGKTVWKRV